MEIVGGSWKIVENSWKNRKIMYLLLKIVGESWNHVLIVENCGKIIESCSYCRKLLENYRIIYLLYKIGENCWRIMENRRNFFKIVELFTYYRK